MLAIILVVAMVLSVSACSLVSKDEDKDAAQVVATVNGVDILKGDVYNALRSNGMSYYGDAEYYFNEENAESYKDAANTALDGLISAEISKQKAKELGLDEITEDEMTELETNAKNYYDYYASQIRSSLTEQNMQYGVTMTDEEIEEEISNTLSNYLGIEDASVEGMLALLKDLQVQMNLQDYLVADITVDEQEVKDYYDAQLDTQSALAEEKRRLV